MLHPQDSYEALGLNEKQTQKDSILVPVAVHRKKSALLHQLTLTVTVLLYVCNVFNKFMPTNITGSSSGAIPR